MGITVRIGGCSCIINLTYLSVDYRILAAEPTISITVQLGAVNQDYNTYSVSPLLLLCHLQSPTHSLVIPNAWPFLPFSAHNITVFTFVNHFFQLKTTPKQLHQIQPGQVAKSSPQNQTSKPNCRPPPWSKNPRKKICRIKLSTRSKRMVGSIWTSTSRSGLTSGIHYQSTYHQK